MTHSEKTPSSTPLGVVIVTFNAADVILECLESLLLQADETPLDIVVVDNASSDGTSALLRAWAEGRETFVPGDDLPFALPPCPKPVHLAGPDGGACPPCSAQAPALTLIDHGVNAGFAGGVNRGLAHLAAHSQADRFWILNPDGVAAPGAARAFAHHDGSDFALMGGRVIYTHDPDMIQIDGGTVNRRTGITGNIHLGRSHKATPPPDPATLDFIMGASMVASRAFYEAAGPMQEDYFLYYEEVDWAWRRGALPLIYCPGGIIYHRAGTAIGSPTLDRIASPFSIYFKHRARRRFVTRHLPGALPGAWAYTLAKAVQYALKGHRAEARALLAGFRDAAPPPAVRDKLAPEAQALAFAPPSA